MSSIGNDREFKQALDSLDGVHQRQVAARFVNSVIDLCQDVRVNRAVGVALTPAADSDQIASAIKSAMQAALDCHARCGAAGNWSEQAGYFVARAAAACLTPRNLTGGKDPAWQTALSCRMARTTANLDSLDGTPDSESAKQYQILSTYLDSLTGAAP